MKATKIFFSLIISLFVLLGMSLSSNAVLVDNNDGTVTQTRNDGSILMWLQDANYSQTSGYDSDGLMNWPQTHTWIDHLNSTNYAGYNDWRLPSAFNSDGSGPCTGYNCSDSELGYMYYIEWNFPAGGDLGSGFGPVLNVRRTGYWSAEEYDPDPFNAWGLDYSLGLQGWGNKASSGSAWAVRSAGVVPEPISFTLFIVGGATLGFRRYWKKR